METWRGSGTLSPALRRALGVETEPCVLPGGRRRGWSQESRTGCLEGCESGRKETPGSSPGQEVVGGGGRRGILERTWGNLREPEGFPGGGALARSDAAGRGKRTVSEKWRLGLGTEMSPWQGKFR